jgi:hypothetical protein
MKKLVQEIEGEGSLHKILKDMGFETNYNKKLNENGTDVVALKNGIIHKIEHKKVKVNKTTKAYKIDGNINGDIVILTTPKNRSFFFLANGKSLTKICRFVDSL